MPLQQAQVSSSSTLYLWIARDFVHIIIDAIHKACHGVQRDIRAVEPNVPYRGNAANDSDRGLRHGWRHF